MTDRKDADRRDQDRDDAAPGDEAVDAHGGVSGVTGYTIGLALAVLLTIGSFMMRDNNLVWGPAIPAGLITLAIAQMGVHLVFFLHVTSGPDNTNNVLALAFGVLIVGLVIFGSIWIMGHLNHNMMPMDGQMVAGHSVFKSPL
jgi:cytochrome o ubiquinol oxidase operon protein cyoD